LAATGASFTFVTASVTVVVLLTPIPSRRRYVKVSVPEKLACGV